MLSSHSPGSLEARGTTTPAKRAKSIGPSRGTLGNLHCVVIIHNEVRHYKYRYNPGDIGIFQMLQMLAVWLDVASA